MTQQHAAQLRLVKRAPARLQVLSELDLALVEYRNTLRQAGRTPDTIEKYLWHLARLLDWLAERGVTRLSDISRPLLREWGAGLYDTPLVRRPRETWSLATVRLATMAAKGFLAWCHAEELLSADVGAALKAPRAKKRTQRTLTADEVLALLARCDDSPAGLRDAALVSLLVDSGLRASEAARLLVSDLNFEVRLPGVVFNFLTVVGKGGDEAAAYFGLETAGRLRAWLQVRAQVARPEVGEVFVGIGGSRPGQAMTRYGIRGILRRLGQRAALSGVTPHALRRAFACLADEAGASTRNIQMWGRWSDMAMVERYTQALKAGKKYAQHSPADHLRQLAARS